MVRALSECGSDAVERLFKALTKSAEDVVASAALFFDVVGEVSVPFVGTVVPPSFGDELATHCSCCSLPDADFLAELPDFPFRGLESLCT